jgi:hypothetical protein
MNLKIGTDGLAGAQAPGASGALETHRANLRPAGGESAAPAGHDTVAISSLSAQIHEALTASQVEAARRLTGLAELYARGQYQVDAVKLSRALVSHALRAGPDGGES